MAHVNDEKYRKLSLALAKGGHIRDLEDEWLLGQLGAYTGPANVNDLWMALFDVDLIAAGQFNDRAYAWLASKGHTQGALNDRWLAYWSS